MIRQRDGLWYVSQPSRLGGMGKESYREKVLEELISQGYDVVHPFNAFPYHHFEGNPAVGREKAMQYCCDLVRMCGGRVLVTGISEGVLLEVEYALDYCNEVQIIALPLYDPEWRDKLLEFEGNPRYKRALEKITSAL